MMLRACSLLPAMTALALLLAPLARGQARFAFEPLAGIGGGTVQSESDTVGGRPILLQLEGNSLAVYALDNPTAPIQIGRLVSPRSLARIFLHRDIAYIVSSEPSGEDDWLTLVDYSDPASPKAIGRKVFQSLRRALCFNGNHLYLSSGTEGLRVFDITVPAAMKDVTGWTNLVFPTDIALQGSRLYASVGNNGFFIYDVANPIQPRKIGEYVDPGLTAMGRIAVTDTVALIDFSNGIRLVSVKDPSKPRAIRDVLLGQDPSRFLIRGGLAYAVSQYSFVSILDIGKPDSARVIGTQRNGGEATQIALAGSHLYAASYARGMQIVSISNPALPVVVRTIATPYFAGDIRQSGKTLYLGADGQGLQIFDLDNPALPRRLSSLDTGVTVSWLETFRDEIAVAGAYGSKLKVIDIRDKYFPKVVDSIALPAGKEVQGLGKAGGHLYVCTNQGLEVYRAAAGLPVAKVYADTFRSDTHGLEVKGSLALIARGHLGLQVADLSVPERPGYLGRIDKLGSALDGVKRFAWHGNMVYTHDDVKGLALIDVTDPYKPVKIGSLADPEYPQEFLVWKTHLLVRSNQDGNFGLHVFDISDPARPVRERIIQFRDLAGDFASMRIVEDRLYLSHSTNGLRMFNLSEETVTSRAGRAKAEISRKAGTSGRFSRHAEGIRRVFDALGRFLPQMR